MGWGEGGNERGCAPPWLLLPEMGLGSLATVWVCPTGVGPEALCVGCKVVCLGPWGSLSVAYFLACGERIGGAQAASCPLAAKEQFPLYISAVPLPSRSTVLIKMTP